MLHLSTVNLWWAIIKSSTSPAWISCKISGYAAKTFCKAAKTRERKEIAVENLLKFEVKQHYRSYGVDGLQSITLLYIPWSGWQFFEVVAGSQRMILLLFVKSESSQSQYDFFYTTFNEEHIKLIKWQKCIKDFPLNKNAVLLKLCIYQIIL